MGGVNSPVAQPMTALVYLKAGVVGFGKDGGEFPVMCLVGFACVEKEVWGDGEDVWAGVCRTVWVLTSRLQVWTRAGCLGFWKTGGSKRRPSESGRTRRSEALTKHNTRILTRTDKWSSADNVLQAHSAIQLGDSDPRSSTRGPRTLEVVASNGQGCLADRMLVSRLAQDISREDRIRGIDEVEQRG